MQGAEYINDLCCNYLTIPFEGEEDFTLRMLRENITEGFLPVELRRLDGLNFLYYNISGMQSMEVIYAEKAVDHKGFLTFMWHLHEAIELSRELFLPGDGICLEPSVLFWNLERQRWEFVYIPGRDKNIQTEIQGEREQLAEFLVTRIDYEDKALTEAAYRFYEEICAGRMYPDAFLEKGGEPDREVKKTRQEEETWRDGVFEDGEDGEEEEDGEDEENTKRREKGTETGKAGGGKILQAVLFILMCIVAAATFLLGRTIQSIIIPGGAVTVLTAGLLLFVRKGQGRGKNEESEDDTEVIYTEEPLWRTENSEEEKETAEEKTVYMDIVQDRRRRLYGTGKFRKHKVCLDRLPCTAGKDKTLVDHIISDSSVSRMHVRFFEEEGNLWMQDLNSTNGTYHNGLRLRPNEKVMLEVEDEVGLGRVQLVFR